MKWLIESEKAPTLLAAVVGLLLRYLMRPHLDVKTACFCVASGLSAAYFAAPVIAAWLGLGPQSLGVIGWLCGMIAADVVQGLIGLSKSWARDPASFIRRWRNGGGEK